MDLAASGARTAQQEVKMKQDKSNPKDLERNLPGSTGTSGSQGDRGTSSSQRSGSNPSSSNPGSISSGSQSSGSQSSDRMNKDRGSEGVSGSIDKDKLGNRGSSGSSGSGSERT
jgi:hypothetical protein